MKKTVRIQEGDYTFNAAAKTITFSGVTFVDKSQILIVVNTNTNGIIYLVTDPDNLGGTLSGQVLTLDYDTTSMLNSDPLKIEYVDEVLEATETTALLIKQNQTNGTQKSIVRGGAKGTTVANDVTSTPVDSNTQALDVSVKGVVPISISSGSISVDNLTATFDSFVSTLNSTNIPLIANEEFVGTWELVKNYAGITVSIFTDQASAVGGGKAQWSIDGTDGGMLDDGSTNAVTIPPNVPISFEFAKKAAYFRIRYRNGATPQTFVKAQVIYNLTAATPNKRILGAQLTDFDSAEAVAAHLSGRQVTGQWKAALINSSGHLSTRVENAETGLAKEAKQDDLNALVNSVLTTLNTLKDLEETIWKDDNGVFYIRRTHYNQSTGAITLTFILSDGTTHVPVEPSTLAVSNSDLEFRHINYVATAGGTGYSSGHYIIRTDILNISLNPSILVNTIWFNKTLGTAIVEPDQANLDEPQNEVEAILNAQSSIFSLESTQLSIKANQNPLHKYKIQDKEDGVTTNYYGFATTGGTYIIMSEGTTSGAFRYANIGNNPTRTTYQLAWTNRATLNFEYIFNLTGV